MSRKINAKEDDPMSPYKLNQWLQKVTKLKLFRPVKRFVIFLVCSFLLFLLLNRLFPIPDSIEYSTTISDVQGQVINAYLTPDEKWRMKTELHEISPLLRKTIIAKEDRYFYDHPGVNPLAMARAAFMNTIRMKRTSGASTITMQVARALEPRKRNLLSKSIEMFRALQLEWKYDKDEILQLYLNLVPYGGNIEGVKSASWLYFKKNPDHLSLAEITALSIIPNRPSTLVIGKRSDLVLQERNRWLKKFADDGVFTGKEIEDALSEPLDAKRTEVPHYIPHLGYKLKTGSSSVNIKTHIDLNNQLKIEKLVSDYVRGLRLKQIRNAAVVVMDNKTGRIISYTGSSDFRDTTDGGQVNGAAAVRQPGSTLKPFLYGLAIDEGLLTPKKIINDVPVNYAGYAPENYDRQFNGYVTMEYALEHSLNIPSVRSLQQLGKDVLINGLAEAGFRQVEKDRDKLGLSMVLGGCGATLEELTALFAAFANEGVYRQPSFSSADTNGKKKRILSAAASYMITEILSKVNRPDFPLNWTATERMPKIAWKTGTSYGRRDAWSIGYNKNFTVGVWVGNFSGQGVPELSGANTATPLLFRIFNTLDYDSNSSWYDMPAECQWRQVCSASGQLPGNWCTNLITDYFIPLASSMTPCKHIEEVKVAPDMAWSYCESCTPAEGFIKKPYRITDMEMQAWFSGNGMAYEKIPPHYHDCEKIFKGNGPQITFPLNGHEYLLSSRDPEPLQLSARTGSDVMKIYWYINDEFYKASPAGEKQMFIPREGPVKISCTDDKGRNRNITIRVKYVDL